MIYCAFINKKIPRYIIAVIIGSIIFVPIIYYIFKENLSLLILFIFLLSLTFIIIGYREGDIELSIIGYTTLVLGMCYLYIYNYMRISNLKKFRIQLNSSIVNRQDDDTLSQLENCESENRHIKNELTNVRQELGQTRFELETLLQISDENVKPKKRKRVG
jgi:Ca2+/Na+ antiporter